MLAIDSVLVDFTEWLCRRFQALTGRTNVWLAFQLTNLSVILYFVWAIIYFQRIDVAVVRIAVAIFCSGVLYVLLQTVFKESVDLSEGEAFRRVAKGLRNPRRIRDAQLRISFLTLSVMLFYVILILWRSYGISMSLFLFGYPLVVLTTILLYVLACDPLPPAPARLKVWLRSLVPASARAREENA
jgi:sterol desaturase/sphingolipid hydroxylase (fatty acid hydroxylase superfamily)